MAKKILYVASTFGHLKTFHIPYLQVLLSQGNEVHVMRARRFYAFYKLRKLLWGVGFADRRAGNILVLAKDATHGAARKKHRSASARAGERRFFPFVQVKVGHRNFVRRAAKARSAVRAGAFAGIWTQIALKIFARGCLNHNYIL